MSPLLSPLAVLLLSPVPSQLPSSSPYPWGDNPPPPVITPEAFDDHVARASALPRADRPPRPNMPISSLPRLPEPMFEEGAWWVRTDRYKAHFDSAGAHFAPYLGSDAPKTFYTSLALADQPLKELRVEGTRVCFDRGWIDEVYELGRESIEQLFILESAPEAGDLVLRVAVESELEPAQSGSGIVFRHERGEVSYSQAAVVGRNGALTPIETEWTGAGIEIRVSAALLERAEWPLVIDPVIGFPIDQTANDSLYPDVAHDATTGNSLFVYTDVFSATDFDVRSALVSAAGAVITSSYVETLAEVWYLPHVANLNAYDQFLVVATTGDLASSVNRRIKGKLTGAAAISYGATLDISGTETDNNLYATVGGDSYTPGPAYFCVGWQRSLSGVQQVVYRLVTTGGAFVTPTATVLQSAFGVKDVSVSRTNVGDRWNIVWDLCPLSAFQCDIRAAQVLWSGGIVTPAFTASNASQVNYAPSASPNQPNSDYLIAWAKDLGADDNIESALFNGSTLLVRTDLSALQITNAGQRQGGAACEVTQDRFVVGWSELYSNSTTDYDPYVASYRYQGGGLQLADRDDLAFTSAIETGVALASQYSAGAGASSRVVAAWSVEPSAGGSSNVQGAFYDIPADGEMVPLCFGDGTGAACPCANNGAGGRGCANSTGSGALLSASGNAQVSADTVVLNLGGMPNPTTCIFLQGNSVLGSGLGVANGDGLICVGTSVVRLAIKSGPGTASYPQSGDLSVSVRGALPAAGGVRYYQGYYRNNAAFCTSATWNFSNAMRFTWLP